MASSPAPKRNLARDSSGKWTLGRIGFWLWLTCFSVVWLAGAPAQATITTIGNVVPPYPTKHPDPWNVGGPLYLGQTASGGMTVDGGSDVSNTHGHVGLLAGASGGAVITGGGSTWENTGDLWLGSMYNSGVGYVTISSGGTVYIGDAASTVSWEDYLIVSDANGSGTDGGHLYVYNGSTLTHDGDVCLGNCAGEYGWAAVDGSRSTWANSGSLWIGMSGSGTLEVQNGGTVSSNHGYLGGTNASTGMATIDGIGSSWTDGETLYVGGSGSGTLTVQNGGNVSSKRGVVGDLGSGSATIKGAGSSWTIMGVLDIADHGSGTLTVQSGGSVSNTNGWLGYYTDGDGIATVTGNGSTWECISNLSLGRSSYGGVGHLTISDAGMIYVGDAARSDAPLGGGLFISDSDSSGATGGHLYLFNGSTCTNSGIHADIGCDAGEFGWVTVDGAGSSWTNASGLYLGLLGSGTLTIQNGGSVSNSTAFLGTSTGGAGTAVVDGPDSSWTNSGYVYVGHYGLGGVTIQNSGSVSIAREFHVGEFNSGTLTVQSGGTVSDTEGWIGKWINGSGTVTVDGAGSSWTNSESLTIGWRGSGTLAIENGGSVSNTDSALGVQTGGIGTVTVTGSASTWECTGDLALGGSSGSGVGHLTISEGGTVFVGNAARSGGTTSWLTVSDVDSSGTVGGHLNVYNGSTLNHGGHAVVGDGSDEYGWATVEDIDSAWTNGGSLYVGRSGSGTLAIRSGGSVSAADGLLGYDPSGTGTVTVTGTGSTWESSGDLWLGRSSPRGGVGDVTVSEGGTVFVGDAARSGGTAGWLTVSDVDSSGTAGGHLNVYHGSTLNHGGHAVVGDGSDEYGWVTVAGSGSSWTSGGSLYVGRSGSGTLAIRSGGNVSHTNGWLGYSPSGTATVTVTGSGSTWESTGDLWLGRSSPRGGVGDVTVSEGGTVFVGDAARSGGTAGWLTVSDVDSSGTAGGHLNIYNGSTLIHGGDADLGHSAGQYGWATVAGSGSSWTNAGTLYVGTAGSGILTIQNAGEVTAIGVSLGQDEAGPDTGVVVVDDGRLVVAGSLVIHQTGRVDFASGTIEASTIDDPHGKFNWTGGTLHVGTFQGSLGNSGGTLAPGTSPGLTEVTGDYTQGGAALLEIEIFGADPAWYDRLHVAGKATLAGTLDVRLMDDFTPSSGDTFDILDWGALSGEFDDVLLPELAGGLTWYLGDLYITGELFVAIPGDANADGVVDDIDATIVGAHWMSTGAQWGDGDFNGDNVVNDADAAILAAHWGEGGGEESVPEPGSLALLAGMVAMGVVCWRRRKA
jgi:fibronectin-binding autotransporter adhesin